MKQKSYSLIDDFNDFDDKKHISLTKSTANIIKELELGTFLYDTFNLVDQSKSKELISFLSINIDNDKLPQIGINRKDLFCTIRIVINISKSYYKGFSIGKCADEWYYLFNKRSIRYFKCDSFEGLTKCITEPMNHDRHF